MSIGTLFPEAGRHDPGGKVTHRLPAGMDGTALFGGDNDEYRYELTRTWDLRLPAVLFVMMNPSKADTNLNDPTVAKNCRYAKAWGYGRVYVGNIFAYRTTDPAGLLACDDPVGPLNDAHLLRMAMDSNLIVFAYGKPPKPLQWRGPQVAAMFRKAKHTLHVLQLCADGTPGHPLYLRGDLKPTEWKEARHG